MSKEILGITHNSFFVREKYKEHYWGFSEEFGENLRVFESVKCEGDKIVMTLIGSGRE